MTRVQGGCAVPCGCAGRPPRSCPHYGITPDHLFTSSCRRSCHCPLRVHNQHTQLTLTVIHPPQYEYSQLLAAAGLEWRKALDAAVALFKGADCSDADVRAALKNHTQAEHLNLGPDPEPATAAEGAK